MGGKGGKEEEGKEVVGDEGVWGGSLQGGRGKRRRREEGVGKKRWRRKWGGERDIGRKGCGKESCCEEDIKRKKCWG